MHRIDKLFSYICKDFFCGYFYVFGVHCLVQAKGAKTQLYSRTAVLGADQDSCLPPCTVSSLRPSVYAKKSASFFDTNNFNTTLVLRMPTIIQLTSSTFSYSFMNFASEFGGTILNLIQRTLFI